MCASKKSFVAEGKVIPWAHILLVATLHGSPGQMTGWEVSAGLSTWPPVPAPQDCGGAWVSAGQPVSHLCCTVS